MTIVKTQQYLFGSEAIPILYHNQTAQFLTMINRDGIKFLRFWWDHVGDKIDPSLRTEPKGLGFQLRELPDGRMMVLLQLPKPENEREAYFMALIPPAPGPRLPMFRIARVFTLEYKPIPEGHPKTELVEWTPRILRHTLGEGPAPDLEVFSQAVYDLVVKKKK